MDKIVNRIRALAKQLSHFCCDAWLIENPTDLFYLTGLSVSHGQLLITKKTHRLFLSPIYLEAGKTSSCCHVVAWTKESLLKTLVSFSIQNLGIDSTHHSFFSVEQLKKLCKKEKINIKPVAHPVVSLREIKEEKEQKLLAAAANLGTRGFRHLIKSIKPGVKESTLVEKLKIFWLENGAESTSFDPIVAFGANSALPHHHPGAKKLKKNDLILIDAGVVKEGYASDMTRTFFLGKPDPELERMYCATLKAQQAALSLCKPGTPLTDLDQAARKVLSQEGLVHLFTHSLGHGIGLQTHEAPFMRNNDQKLQAGMVITIEPGTYLPGKGGIRIEDTVIITEKGHKNLSRFSKKPKLINWI